MPKLRTEAKRQKTRRDRSPTLRTEKPKGNKYKLAKDTFSRSVLGA